MYLNCATLHCVHSPICIGQHEGSALMYTQVTGAQPEVQDPHGARKTIHNTISQTALQGMIQLLASALKSQKNSEQCKSAPRHFYRHSCIMCSVLPTMHIRNGGHVTGVVL